MNVKQWRLNTLKKEYLQWSKTVSAGESRPPTNPVTPLAGSWSLFFLKQGEEGEFLDPYGKELQFPIKDPRLINFNKELRIVQHTLMNLTSKEEKIAKYYGTGVPTKQWTPVIDRLIDTYDVTPTYAARILANVHAAINDTMVVVWNLKYKWDVARPNQYDQTLKTLLCTPRFPAYPSGHATMSGCAEVILSYYFPKEARKLKKIADDNATSRLYGGVHFPSDNNEGLHLGRYIGNVIINYLKTQQDSNENTIDIPYNTIRNADIFPQNYKQFIPYNFPTTCSTLVIGSEKENHKCSNLNLPKPLLYLAKK